MDLTDEDGTFAIPNDAPDVGDRVEVSKEVLGHPHIHHDAIDETPPAEEGKHFEVLTYTDWADYFVPTAVKWANGELDDFSDKRTSIRNRQESVAQVDVEENGEPEGWDDA